MLKFLNTGQLMFSHLECKGLHVLTIGSVCRVEVVEFVELRLPTVELITLMHFHGLVFHHAFASVMKGLHLYKSVFYLFACL